MKIFLLNLLKAIGLLYYGYLMYTETGIFTTIFFVVLILNSYLNAKCLDDLMDVLEKLKYDYTH